jgi:hypothetical protein
MEDCWSSRASPKPGMVRATACTSVPSRRRDVEVGTEDLDRDRRGDAAEHVADPVGERTADDREGAGHRARTRRPRSSRISCRLRRPPSVAEIDVELRGGDGHDVVAALGAAEAAADLAHLGHGEDLPLDRRRRSGSSRSATCRAPP